MRLLIGSVAQSAIKDMMNIFNIVYIFYILWSHAVSWLRLLVAVVAVWVWGFKGRPAAGRRVYWRPGPHARAAGVKETGRAVVRGTQVRAHRSPHRMQSGSRCCALRSHRQAQSSRCSLRAPVRPTAALSGVARDPMDG